MSDGESPRGPAPALDSEVLADFGHQLRNQLNAIEYINHSSALYKDTKRIEKAVMGLSVSEVWLTGKLGSVSEPAVVRGLAHFEDDLKHDPRVGSVVGLPALLRTLRYATGKGDKLPEDNEALERITDTLESLLDRAGLQAHACRQQQLPTLQQGGHVADLAGVNPANRPIEILLAGHDLRLAALHDR